MGKRVSSFAIYSPVGSNNSQCPRQRQASMAIPCGFWQRAAGRAILSATGCATELRKEENMPSLQGTRITWLGHATVLIQTPKGTNLLIDPFIAQNPKYPKNYQLPSKIDYVLLTHGHGDHISDAVPVAKKHGSTVVAIYELADYIVKKGVDQGKTIGMN